MNGQDMSKWKAGVEWSSAAKCLQKKANEHLLYSSLTAL